MGFGQFGKSFLERLRNRKRRTEAHDSIPSKGETSSSGESSQTASSAAPTETLTVQSGSYLVLLSTSVTGFNGAFAQSSVLLALPTIAAFFNASFIDLIWITSGSLLTSACLQAAFGKIADIKGRKRLQSAGILLFIVSMVLSALAPNIVFLIIAQVINGIARAGIGSVGTALLAASFPSSKRGRILGMNNMSGYAGLGSGPLIAGLLIETFGWRSVFYLPALISIPAFIMLQLFVKERRLVPKSRRFDLPGALSFSSFLMTLMMIITGVAPNYDIALGIICIVCFTFFFQVERRAENPLIDFQLFRRNGTFVTGCLTGFLNFLPSSAYILVLSIYLQVVVGYSPALAGAILLLPRFVMMIIVPISGALSDRISSRIVGSTGMLIRSIGFIMCGFLSAGFPVQYIWIPLVLIGIGQGSFSAPNTQMVMNSVTQEKFGMASGTLGTITSTSQPTGVGFVGAIISAFLPAGGYAQINTANGSTQVSQNLQHLYVVGMDRSFLLLGILLIAGMAVYAPKSKKSREYQKPVN